MKTSLSSADVRNGRRTSGESDMIIIDKIIPCIIFLIEAVCYAYLSRIRVEEQRRE